MHRFWRRYLPWLWLFWLIVGLVLLVADSFK